MASATELLFNVEMWTSHRNICNSHGWSLLRRTKITFVQSVNGFRRLWVNDQPDTPLRYIIVYYYNPLHV